ncbi:1218_t:CDS:2 [Gigaspora rosea]|nr:1218_t:CDS:2 [Gigaspora rosea]
MDAQEYIIADNDIITTEMPTDEEIIEAVKNRDCIEPEEEDPYRPISLADALKFISGILTFLEQQPDGSFKVDDSFVRNLGKLKKESPQINEEKISRREHGRERKRGRGQGRENKRGKSNTVLEREVKILAQLPAPPDFNYLKHNIPLHQNFTRLPPAFSDKILPHMYIQSKNASVVGRSWSPLVLDELKIWLEIIV